MANRTNLNLDVDLQHGVVPISKAASSLAALIKRANSTGRPMIVTQKGYPSGVLLPIDLFSKLKTMADELALDVSDEDSEEAERDEEPAPVDEKPRRRSKSKADDNEE